MENKKRTLLAVLFLLFCLLGIAALYGQARQPAEGTGGHSSNRQKVTLIAKSTESAFWKSVFAGAAQRIRLVAFDSNVVSVDMLETGEVDALVVQNPYAIGYLGVETAYRLLNGQKIPSPEIDTSTMLVTRENMYTEESQRILFSFDEIK